MTYRIAGLPTDRFASLLGRDDAELAEHGAVRVHADKKPGYPCRITLEDAEPGETLLLVHHEDHAVGTPYRNAYAIYVREQAGAPAEFVDTVPPVMRGRPIALRAFDSAGMLRTAALALKDDVDAQVRTLFDQPEIAYIHAHNAAYGCFAARIERH